MNVRVLLVDDHRIFCDGVKLLLEREPHLEVVGIAGDGREAVLLAGRLRPEVVVMDVVMPGLNGVEATRQILQTLPQTKVIALSMHGDRRSIDGMLRAGVAGYLVKECAADDLVRAIQMAMSGKVFLSPEVASILVQGYAHPQEENGVGTHAGLTSREMEVLQLLAEGHSTRDISLTLHISIKTVESHRRQIMEKRRLKSLADLTKYAIREGITTLGSC